MQVDFFNEKQLNCILGDFTNESEIKKNLSKRRANLLEDIMIKVSTKIFCGGQLVKQSAFLSNHLKELKIDQLYMNEVFLSDLFDISNSISLNGQLKNEIQKKIEVSIQIHKNISDKFFIKKLNYILMGMKTSQEFDFFLFSRKSCFLFDVKKEKDEKNEKDERLEFFNIRIYFFKNKNGTQVNQILRKISKNDVLGLFKKIRSCYEKFSQKEYALKFKTFFSYIEKCNDSRSKIINKDKTFFSNTSLLYDVFLKFLKNKNTQLNNNINFKECLKLKINELMVKKSEKVAGEINLFLNDLFCIENRLSPKPFFHKDLFLETQEDPVQDQKVCLFPDQENKKYFSHLNSLNLLDRIDFNHFKTLVCLNICRNELFKTILYHISEKNLPSYKKIDEKQIKKVAQQLRFFR